MAPWPPEHRVSYLPFRSCVTIEKPMRAYTLRASALASMTRSAISRSVASGLKSRRWLQCMLFPCPPVKPNHTTCRCAARSPWDDRSVAHRLRACSRRNPSTRPRAAQSSAPAVLVDSYALVMRAHIAENAQQEWAVPLAVDHDRRRPRRRRLRRRRHHAHDLVSLFHKLSSTSVMRYTDMLY
jgi:hypothetical protein